MEKQLKHEVIEHGNSFIITDNDDKRAKLFKQFEQLGYVECYDSMFSNLYYSLTKKGKAVI